MVFSSTSRIITTLSPVSDSVLSGAGAGTGLGTIMFIVYTLLRQGSVAG